MTQWRIGASGTVTCASGITRYVTVLPGFAYSNGTTEAPYQVKFYVAYTCTDLRVNVSTITAGSTSTVTLRDDAADTTVAVSVTATGWTEDLTDSATPAANSLMAFTYVQTSAMHSETVTFEVALMTIEHASTTAPLFGSSFDGAVSTTYTTLGGAASQWNTRADVESEMQRAITFSNLRINTLTVSGTWTVAPWKNGAASTNITLSVSASGAIEDVTGSEAFASGDKAAFGQVEDSAGSLDDIQLQVQGDVASRLITTRQLAGITTRSYGFFSGGALATADDNYLWRSGSITAQNLETVCTTAGSGTRDATLRVNSTNSTNLTISVTATGYFEDLTGSEAVADGDSVTATLASTGTAITLQFIGVELPWFTGVTDTLITVPVATLTLTSFAPSAIKADTITVPVATLTLSSFAPGANIGITVPVANLTLTSFAPTITVSNNVQVTVPVASLSLGSFAPIVVNPAGVTVPVASLTLSVFAPGVTVGINVTVPVSILTLSSFAPTIVNPQGVTVPAATLTLATFAPVAGLTVTVPVAALTLTAFEPTVTASSGSDVVITVPVASLTLSAFAPAIDNPQGVVVPVATLTLNAFAPTVDITVLVVVPAATISLTSFAPSVINPQGVTVPVSALSLGSFAPSVQLPVLVTVPVATLSLSVFTPTVAFTAHIAITIPVALLILTSYSPVIAGIDAPAWINVPLLADPETAFNTSGFYSTPSVSGDWTGGYMVPARRETELSVKGHGD